MFLLPLHVAYILASDLDDRALQALAIAPEELTQADEAIGRSGIRGLLLTTCHRVALVWWGDVDGESWLREWLGARTGAASIPLRRASADLAVRHLLSLAAGLESPLLGEPEIHGQLRAAWRRAMAAGVICAALDDVIAQVIAGSRRIRAALQHGRPAPDLGERVARLVQERCADLARPPRVLVVGTGALAASTLRAVRGCRPDATLVVCGRTPARVHTVSRAHAALSRGWDDLPDELAIADAAIFSIRSNVVLPRTVLGALHPNHAVWIDLAVPSVLPASDPSLPRTLRLAELATPSPDDHLIRDSGRRALQEELARMAEHLHRRRIGRGLATAQQQAGVIAADELSQLAVNGAVTASDLEVLARRVAQRVLHPALRLLGDPVP